MTPRDRDFAINVTHTRCPNCGEPDSHFCPPCFGDPGFYTCATPEQIDQRFTEYDDEVMRNYAPSSPKYQMSKMRSDARRSPARDDA